MLPLSTLSDLFKNPGVLVGMGIGLCLGLVMRGQISDEKDYSKEIEKEDDDDSDEDEFLASDENYEQNKLVLVVRSDLKMGKGKIAAQCCHATVKAYKQTKRLNPKILRQWETNGQPKVVVKGENEETLFELANTAEELGLITSIIQDAGRTQVTPGSRTVLALGPGPIDLINAVSGHLKLL